MKAHRCEWLLVYGRTDFIKYDKKKLVRYVKENLTRKSYDGKDLYRAYKLVSYEISFRSEDCENMIAPFDVVRGPDPVDTYPY